MSNVECQARHMQQVLVFQLTMIPLIIICNIGGPSYLIIQCVALQCEVWLLALPIAWTIGVGIPAFVLIACRWKEVPPLSPALVQSFDWQSQRFFAISIFQIAEILLAGNIVIQEILSERSMGPMGYAIFSLILLLDIFIAARSGVLSLRAKRYSRELAHAFDNDPEKRRQEYVSAVASVCSSFGPFDYCNPRQEDAGGNPLICGGTACSHILHDQLHPLQWFTDQTACTFCLCDFVHGESVMHPPCGHLFHATCYASWMLRCMCKPGIQEFSQVLKCPFNCTHSAADQPAGQIARPRVLIGHLRLPASSPPDITMHSPSLPGLLYTPERPMPVQVCM